MKVEILYKEIANLFGESGNIEILRKIFYDADFIYTNLLEQPKFTKEDIDLVFLGAMSEKNQEAVIHELTKYKKEIRERIEHGQHVLCTGNALEVFGEKIIQDSGEEISALGIFPYYAKRQMMDRLNCIYVGSYNDLDVIGFKTQFTQCYPTEKINYLLTTKRGFGMNKNECGEGIVYKNFIGTYLVGPLLVSNPKFTAEWLKRFEKKYKVPYYDTLLEAYEIRLAEFNNPKTTS